MATDAAQWQSQPNLSQDAIDLTNEDNSSPESSDDDQEMDGRAAKRQKITPSPSAEPQPQPTPPTGGAYRSPQVLGHPPIPANFARPYGAPVPAAPWAQQGSPIGQAYFNAGQQQPQRPQVVPPPVIPGQQYPTPGASRAQAIDLTTEGQSTERKKDARKDVVCIGEITVTALVLYPIEYLLSSPAMAGREEFVPVRLIYDANNKKRSRMNEETIRITAPLGKAANGEPVGGDDFGVVEQRVANVLGPLMAKVLIRVSATIRRAAPNVRAYSAFHSYTNFLLTVPHPLAPYPHIHTKGQRPSRGPIPAQRLPLSRSSLRLLRTLPP